MNDEQTCKQAYDDFYHKIKAEVGYDHWCAIWRFISKRQARGEPVAWAELHPRTGDVCDFIRKDEAYRLDEIKPEYVLPLYTTPQPKQHAGEPVAWLRNERGGYEGKAIFDPLVILGSAPPTKTENGATYSPVFSGPQPQQQESEPVKVPSDAELEKAWDSFEAEMARHPTDDELEEFMAQFADEAGHIHDDRHAEAARALLASYGQPAQPANTPPVGALNPELTLKGLIHKIEVAANPNQGAVPWFMCSLLQQALPHLRVLDAQPAVSAEQIDKLSLTVAGKICRHLDTALDQSKVQAAAYDIAYHFAAPVVAQPIVPEPLKYGGKWKDHYVTGWNNCRAAMLEAAPVPGAAK